MEFEVSRIVEEERKKEKGSKYGRVFAVLN